MSDWLDLHELNVATCQRLLEAASELGSAVAGPDKLAMAQSEIDHDSAWQSASEAMRLFFPGRTDIIDDTFHHTVRMLVSAQGRPRAALTIDHGANTYPSILYGFLGKPSDLLVIAHEFAHALQIRASEGRFVSPVVREVCAFLGERARLSLASATDAAQHRHLIGIWNADNQKHFGVGRMRLMSALSQPDMAYSYSWNYPIARYLALCVEGRSPPDRMWRLFEGRTSFALLLEDLGLVSGQP